MSLKRFLIKIDFVEIESGEDLRILKHVKSKASRFITYRSLGIA